MIIIIRALSQWGKDDGDYDSPTSRDETPDEKQKKGREKRGHKKKRKKAQIKKKRRPKERKEGPKKYERKREKGQCYYPFFTLVLQSSTMIFMIESLLICHFHILVGIFHYRTWLVYSNDGLPQIALGLHEQASWMHTHLVCFVELSYTYSSSASVAWKSLLTHINIY